MTNEFGNVADFAGAVTLVATKIALRLSNDRRQYFVEGEGRRELENYLSQFLEGTVKEKPPVAEPITKKLLAPLMSVNVPTLPQFAAADNFKEDTKGAVRIWSLGDNFKAKFLGKTEGATEAVDIKIHKLLKQSRDPVIMTELGSAYEMTLSQFFYLLSKQGKGEVGPLLINGWVNVAYIPDDDGVVRWAVRARWSAASAVGSLELTLSSIRTLGLTVASSCPADSFVLSLWTLTPRPFETFI